MISAEDCRSYMLCTNNADEDFESSGRKGFKLQDAPTPKKKEQEPEVDELQVVIDLFGG